MSKPPHLLIVSSVPPANRGGGEVSLKRRLESLHEATWSVVTDAPLEGAGDSVQLSPVVRRLQRTRVGRWAHAWSQFHPGRAVEAAVDQHLRAQRPDAIVTVAHGILWPVALAAARRYQLPLATFFMDWWPDLAFVPDWYRPRIENAFRALYRQSDQVFLSSPALRAELGPHPAADVLYDGATSVSTAARRRSGREPRFRLVYLGNTRDLYAQPLLDLYRAAREHPRCELRIIGAPPDWPQALVEQAKAEGVYRGALSDDAAADELADADALLVVMSHALAQRRRMETSFPSKIAHYCQLARPLLVWAPAYSSAAVWARTSGAACLTDSPDAADVLRALDQLASDPALTARLTEAAKRTTETEFNLETAQASFRAAITRLVGNRPTAHRP